MWCSASPGAATELALACLVCAQVFVDQQTKFRALVEGAKGLAVPETADAAAVSKFQADYDALRKKARRTAQTARAAARAGAHGAVVPSLNARPLAPDAARRPHAPAALVHAACPCVRVRRGW